MCCYGISYRPGALAWVSRLYSCCQSACPSGSQPTDPLQAIAATMVPVLRTHMLCRMALWSNSWNMLCKAQTMQVTSRGRHHLKQRPHKAAHEKGNTRHAGAMLLLPVETQSSQAEAHFHEAV